MTREEIRNYAKENNCCDIDVVRLKNKRGNIHSDNIDMFELSDVSDQDLENCELYVMDKEDYKNTILANSCVCWEDMYRDDDNVLVVVIE